MDDFLPPPPHRPNGRPPLSLTTPGFRKRGHRSPEPRPRWPIGPLIMSDDNDNAPSSDLPMFSSDDVHASTLENYEHDVFGGQGHGDDDKEYDNYHPDENSGLEQTETATGTVRQRTKRQYRGTWWGETMASSRPKRARLNASRSQFKRFDSGVYICSDDLSMAPSSDRVEPMFSEAAAPVPLPVPLFSQKLQPTRGQGNSDAHTQAQAIVGTCVDDGHEDVDLSHLNLRTIPPGLLQPLAHLTKLPPPLSGAHAPDEAAFGPLEPSLRLFLAHNALNTTPTDVWRLGAPLRVLSLRHNRLSRLEMPGDIAQKVPRLRALNVATNRLRTLPWELLTLFRRGKGKCQKGKTVKGMKKMKGCGHRIGSGSLTQLTVHPNPFIVPDAVTVFKVPTMSMPESRTVIPLRPSGADPRAPLFVGHNPVQYFDADGWPVPLSDRYDRPSETVANKNIFGTMPAAEMSASATPSLRELCLRAYNRHPHLERLLALEFKFKLQFEAEADLDDAWACEDEDGTDTDTHLSASSPVLNTNPNSDVDLDKVPEPTLPPLPPAVHRLLSLASRVRAAGGRVCASCGTRFVVARARWVEWWDVEAALAATADSGGGNGESSSDCVDDDEDEDEEEEGWDGNEDENRDIGNKMGEDENQDNEEGSEWYQRDQEAERRVEKQVHPLPFVRLACRWGCVPEEVKIRARATNDVSVC